MASSADRMEAHVSSANESAAAVRWRNGAMVNLSFRAEPPPPEEPLLPTPAPPPTAAAGAAAPWWPLPPPPVFFVLLGIHL